MKKTWETPAVETLEIADTLWNEKTGTDPDFMYEGCDPLYHPSES